MNALPLKNFSRFRLKRFICILFTPPPHSWSTNLIQNSGLAMHSRITIKAQTIIPLIVSHFSLPLNGTVSLNGKSSNWRASRCAVRCLCWVCFYTCCDGGLEIFRFKSCSIVIQVHKKRDLQEQILPLSRPWPVLPWGWHQSIKLSLDPLLSKLKEHSGQVWYWTGAQPANKTTP